MATGDNPRARSVIEMVALRQAADKYDAVILGGGLAGLTLAIQLKRARPQTSVLVLEKREGPAPLAAFKVGESTVPSGAHYFRNVIGMADHIEEKQLPKCGLRFFLPAGDNSDLVRRREFGPRSWPHPDVQIDRGSFENELARRASSAGVDLLQGTRVVDVTLAPDGHSVTFAQLGNETTVEGRWVVDACGRAHLLRKKLGLGTKVGHVVNSAWLRLGGGFDIEELGRHDAAFMSYVTEPGIRKFSTNHLLGRGYWVWLIPLSSGPISIGVCADDSIHPFEEISTLDAFLEWMRRHEPQLGEILSARTDQVEDFLRVKDYAYGIERVFSADRWSLVGEAGAFADPLYSPGSDFIAYGNTFTTDLIKRDLDGQDVSQLVDRYNDFYLRTWAGVMSRTEHEYALFGNAYVTAAKLAWSYLLNHTGVTLLMFNNKLTDLDFMDTVDPDILRLHRLNLNMQRLFREWHEIEQRPLVGPQPGPNPLFASREGLYADLDDDGIRALLREHVGLAEAFAVTIFHHAVDSLARRPTDDKPVNPYAVGVRPERWEPEGLFDEPGITKAQALERTGGVEWIYGARTASDESTAVSQVGPV